MKKKILLGALIAISAGSIFAGCSSASQEETTTATTTPESTTVTTTVQEAELEILDSSYVVTGGTEGLPDFYINAFALVKNTSEKEAIQSPMVTFTAKDGEGAILANQEAYGMYIAPGETKVISTMMTTGNKDAANVDVTTNKPTFVKEDATQPKGTDFEVSNTNLKTSDNEYDNNTIITGEVKNNFTEDLDSVAVNVVLKQGDTPVDCLTAYINGLAAGESKAFEASSGRKTPEFDSYDVYVENW